MKRNNKIWYVILLIVGFSFFILGCPGYYEVRNGRYVCDVAGPGEGERCGCVKKYIIIGKDYECDISWDLGLMAQCALEGGICLALCYFFPEPASCSDCLCDVDLDCCGGDGCTPCDFILCEKDEETWYPVRDWVFDYFEGDSCGG